MTRPIRIGTRDSELAMWQAHTVKEALEHLGHPTEIVPVKSQGDLILDKPLYEFGITGIFTKSLDIALLQNEIDIAVHSMKDVPTSLPNGLAEAAVLKRAPSHDLLIHKGLEFLHSSGTVATGSLRRKAQWLNRYPNHQVVNLRGNVNTRLKKLEDHTWNAAIFAAAGMIRLGIEPEQAVSLDWMVPAPAQGAMLVVARKEDEATAKAVAPLHHGPTATCVHIEREFLKTLEGGCTAPIGASAVMEGDNLKFKGILLSVDGKEKYELEKTIKSRGSKGLGKACAEEILAAGGQALMALIKSQVKNL